MRILFQHYTKYKLIYLGIVIQLLYFPLALHTGLLASLFSGDALHYCCQGMDFYQIPNGAYAYWHGGSLTGAPLPYGGTTYAAGHTVNSNVYHPFFTLIVGTPLLLLSPVQAFYTWIVVKLLLTLTVTAYFFWNFRQEKYIGLAVFVLLANASQYLETAVAQFQSILNAFLLLFLIALVRNQSARWGGILYCLTLLVKPIGILWLGVLLCKRRFTQTLFGATFFAALTIPFLISGSGSYYLKNLSTNLLSTSTDGPVQIITLRAFLLHSSPLPSIIVSLIGGIALVLVLFFGALRRVHIAKGMFLTMVYYLCFYDQVYEYQWTSLAPVLAICLVCCPEFQTRLARCLVLLTCLPSVFVLLNFWHVGVTVDRIFGLNPVMVGWQWMVVSKVGPLLLLTISVLIKDIVPTYRQVNAFWKALREVNRGMNVFG